MSVHKNINKFISFSNNSKDEIRHIVKKLLSNSNRASRENVEKIMVKFYSMIDDLENNNYDEKTLNLFLNFFVAGHKFEMSKPTKKNLNKIIDSLTEIINSILEGETSVSPSNYKSETIQTEYFKQPKKEIQKNYDSSIRFDPKLSNVQNVKIHTPININQQVKEIKQFVSNNISKITPKPFFQKPKPKTKPNFPKKTCVVISNMELLKTNPPKLTPLDSKPSIISKPVKPILKFDVLKPSDHIVESPKNIFTKISITNSDEIKPFAKIPTKNSDEIKPIINNIHINNENENECAPICSKNNEDSDLLLTEVINMIPFSELQEIKDGFSKKYDITKKLKPTIIGF